VDLIIGARKHGENSAKVERGYGPTEPLVTLLPNRLLKWGILRFESDLHAAGGEFAWPFQRIQAVSRRGHILALCFAAEHGQAGQHQRDQHDGEGQYAAVAAPVFGSQGLAFAVPRGDQTS